MANKKMEVVSCVMCGKFYDKNTYSVCPHCGEKGEVSVNAVESEDRHAEANIPKSGGLIHKILPSRQKKSEAKDVVENSKDIIVEAAVPSNVSDDIGATVLEREPYEPLPVKMTDGADEKDEVKPIIPAALNKPKIPSPVQTGGAHNDDMRTVQMFNLPTEPVVGWLVCVKGECQGESFEIRSGNNNLGRSQDNDICISDSTISREQAIVIFEPRKQNFYIKPKDNSQFMYVGGDEVAERIQMTPYMKIEIGDKAEFIFVPFSGEKFNWKDYIEE